MTEIGEPQRQENGLSNEDWTVILGTIRDRRCTPFLGAGVNYGILPLAAQIANEWAIAEGYPMMSRDDLSSVAQFLSVKFQSGIFPKAEIVRRLAREPRPDFSLADDDRLVCLRALAKLPLPVYITTNYDELMEEALRFTSPSKRPRREFCRWHPLLKSLPSAYDSTYEPDEINPLVYHLHGIERYPNSLVLTEDDYLDFLVNVSRSQKLIPPRIQAALTSASLLFVGYRLKDINFRVIHRGLVESMDRGQRELGVTVQITPPDGHSGDPKEAQDFLNKYFIALNVRVYWGTASQFAEDLQSRWENYRK